MSRDGEIQEPSRLVVAIVVGIGLTNDRDPELPLLLLPGVDGGVLGRDQAVESGEVEGLARAAGSFALDFDHHSFRLTDYSKRRTPAPANFLGYHAWTEGARWGQAFYFPSNSLSISPSVFGRSFSTMSQARASST